MIFRVIFSIRAATVQNSKCSPHIFLVRILIVLQYYFLTLVITLRTHHLHLQKKKTTETLFTLICRNAHGKITKINCHLSFVNSIRGSGSPIMSNSPIHISKLDAVFTTTANTSVNVANPIGINSVSSTNSNTKLMDQSILSPSTSQQLILDTDDISNSAAAFIATTPNMSKDATPLILAQWLNMHRLGQYVATFSQFSGADLLRMSKEDLVQICGLADGIRLYNTIHSK